MEIILSNLSFIYQPLNSLRLSSKIELLQAKQLLQLKQQGEL
jgi:hypothetical protein